MNSGRSVYGAEEAGLGAILAPVVFDWVDIDVEDRAWLLAEDCPSIIARPDEPITFARQMLERYGAIEQVRRSLHANNFSEGGSRPASEYYGQKLAALDAHASVETNANIRLWLKEHREQLVRTIEHQVEEDLRESELRPAKCVRRTTCV